MNNAQKLLKTIQARKIIQKTRFEFVCKNLLFWIIFGLSIIIGSLSFSIILFVFSQAEFDLLSHLTNSKIEFILGLLPFFWIVACISFLFVSIFGLHRTKTGYRYSPFLIFGSSILFSLVLGTAFFFTGGAEKMERIFAETVPIYKSFTERKIARWSLPEKGFLSGKIIEKKETFIIIKDWDGKEWKIDFENAFIRGRLLLEKGIIIKIIGKISENDIFVAENILSWNGKRNLEIKAFEQN